jgi:hypothetical protein
MPSKSTSTRRQTPGAGTPFVGRARDLGLLRDALTAAEDGPGRLGAPMNWCWVMALRALVAAPEALDGDAARFRFFCAVVTTLARAAADRPLVVLLDDLHCGSSVPVR